MQVVNETDADDDTTQVSPPPAKVRRGLGGLYSQAKGSTSAAPDGVDNSISEISDRNLAHLEAVAHKEVEAYLRAPVFDVPLFPSDGKRYWDPIDSWKEGNCVPLNATLKPFMDGASKKHSFLAATAMAYHGGHAAAGRPERLFRDAGFINNVLRQRQKPSTLSRLSMLKKNKAHRIAIKDAIATYVAKHPKSRKIAAAAATGTEASSPGAAAADAAVETQLESVVVDGEGEVAVGTVTNV